MITRRRYRAGMKNVSRCTLLSFLLLGTSMAYGALPPIGVTVFDNQGRAVFQGKIDGNGMFVTGPMASGNHVVQFNSANAAGNLYSLVVSSGRKHASAVGIPGENFSGGGVAMKIEESPGSQIVGQIASGVAARSGASNLVWIAQRTGSQVPGRWALAGAAETVPMFNTVRWSTDSIVKIQDHGDYRH